MRGGGSRKARDKVLHPRGSVMGMRRTAERNRRGDRGRKGR